MEIKLYKPTKKNQIKTILSFIFLLFLSHSNAQNYIYSGKVIDQKTKEPLAFVNLIGEKSYSGTSSDINGKFKIASNSPIQQLRISSVGYEKKSIELDQQKKDQLLIQLKPIAFDLNEVIILPGENPALRIINNTIKKRKQNNYKKLAQWSYESYENFFISADLDSIPLEKIQQDTSLQELKKFSKNSHFFLVENIVEKKFKRPGNENEKIIGTKVSGFKDPIFMMLISKIQSDNFYEDIFAIGSKKYYNPLSPTASKKYIFLLQDTLYNQPIDTTFIISFFPRKNTNFDGLKGTIAINSKQWAIANVKAEPAEKSNNFEISIQQQFQLIQDSIWFPEQLNTNLTIFPNKDATSSSTSNTDTVTSKGNESLAIIGVGKTYIRKINLDPELRNRDFTNIAIELDGNANNQSAEFWNKYREDSLSEREVNTYRIVDSIGKENNFDKLSRGLLTLQTGYLPWGFFDLNLTNIVRFNEFEGIRLGFGGRTNSKLIKWMSLHGYLAYGFQDFHWKYGGGTWINVVKNKQFGIGFDYTKDVRTEGDLNFFHKAQKRSLLLSNNLYINQMNYNEDYRLFSEFRALKHFKFHLGVFHRDENAYKNNQFIQENGVIQQLNQYSGYQIGVRLAPFEKFIKIKDNIISQGTKWPIINLTYTRGIKGVLDSQYDFNRLDLDIKKSFYIKFIGNTKINIKAGIIDKPIPRSALYNMTSSYNHWGLVIPGTFNTMRLNEFYSDRYVACFIAHSFGKLLIQNKYFKPELVLTHNAAWGAITHPELQLGNEFKSLDLGYYEAGCIVEKLLNIKFTALGVGVFYRYGPNSFNKVSNNFTYKVSLSLNY